MSDILISPYYRFTVSLYRYSETGSREEMRPVKLGIWEYTHPVIPGLTLLGPA
jgi:hypothetical protein